MSAERFASGEIAWQLNTIKNSDGSQSENRTNGSWTWYQAIGTDSAPVLKALEGNTVYAEKMLDNNAKLLSATYSNQAPQNYSGPYTLSEVEALRSFILNNSCTEQQFNHYNFDDGKLTIVDITRLIKLLQQQQ